MSTRKQMLELPVLSGSLLKSERFWKWVSQMGLEQNQNASRPWKLNTWQTGPEKGTEGLGEPSSAHSSFWEHTKRSPTCQESMRPSLGYTRPQRHPTGPAGEAGEVGKDQTSVQRRKQRRRDAHTPAHPPSRAGITTQINRKPKKKKKGTGQKGTRSASEENRKVKEALT